MTYAVSIPQNLKYKRFNKRFSKISRVAESKFNTVANVSGFICGLKCLEGGFVSIQKIHQYILLLRRAIGKGRLGWSRLRLFLNVKIPKTAKSAGHRMGKGKGAVRFWGMTVRQGAFIFKIKKSPFKFKYIDSASWSFLYAVEEFIETYSMIYISQQEDESIRSHKILNIVFNNTAVSLFITYLINQFKTLSEYKLKFIASKLRNYMKNIKQTSNFLAVKHNTLGKKESSYFLILMLTLHGMLRVKKKINMYRYKYRNPAKKFVAKTFKKYKTKYLFFRKYKIRTLFVKKILNYMMLSSSIVADKCSDLIDPDVIDAEFEFLETKAYIENFKKYPDFKISYIPSLYRGLYRIKKKLPFKTEVIFFDQLGLFNSEMSSKKRTLKHTSQK